MIDDLGLTHTHFWWIAVGSAVMFLAGIVAIPLILARIPSDYFISHPIPLAAWKESHPLLRFLILLLRNATGLIFIVLGAIMLVMPGQGILTIVIGVSLTTFPGKRNLEIKLLNMKGVRTGIQWLRAKTGREPLIFPTAESSESTGRSAECD